MVSENIKNGEIRLLSSMGINMSFVIGKWAIQQKRGQYTTNFWIKQIYFEVFEKYFYPILHYLISTLFCLS